MSNNYYVEKGYVINYEEEGVGDCMFHFIIVNILAIFLLDTVSGIIIFSKHRKL